MRFNLFCLIFLSLHVASQQFYPLAGCQSSICAFPPNAADFLVGSLFDFRIEIHSSPTSLNLTSANDIQVKLKLGHQSHNPSHFYSTLPRSEFWSFTYARDAEHYSEIARNASAPLRMKVHSLVWRNLKQRVSGEIQIIITVPSRNLTEVLNWTVHAKKQRKARNVILAISDGTSTAMISAARLIAKRDAMRSGKFKLHMDTFFSHMGHIITNGMDSLITDSANSATAYSTGHKTSTGALGVYVDSTPSHLDKPKQEHIMEILRRERPGCALGIVTTADIVDATPAAFYAHTSNRDAKPMILDQLLNGSHGWDGLPVRADVVLGGGGKYFTMVADSENNNGSDYYSSFEQEGYQIILNATALSTINPFEPLLGIFAMGNMNVWMDRHLLKHNLAGKGHHPSGNSADALDQPNLPQMTLAALDVLKERGSDGFFLLVEAASVDKMNHQLDTNRALADLLEMDKTLEAISRWLKENGLEDDTLMIFTSDHGHGFEVYGTVDTHLFNKQKYEPDNNLDKREAIGTYEQGGWPNYKDTDGDGWIDVWDPRYTLAITMGGTPTHYQNHQLTDSIAPIVKLDPLLTAQRGQNVYTENTRRGEFRDGIKRDGNINARENFGVHSMQDVPVFASGPGAEKVGRVFDNNELFFVMADALGLGTEIKEQVEEWDDGVGVKLTKRAIRETQKIKHDFPEYPKYRHMQNEL